MSLEALLTGSHERADDLRRTLAFDVRPLLLRSDSDSTQKLLSRFQQLSQQLSLLSERSADASADALLARHFAVPSGVADGGGSLPLLLSTRLEKEQEDSNSRLARAASGGTSGGGGSGGPPGSAVVRPAGATWDEAAVAARNASVQRAHQRLAQLALHAELPGAETIARARMGAMAGAEGGGGRGVPPDAATGRGNAAQPAAPSAGTAPRPPQLPATVGGPATVALLAALRTGEGLQPPAPPEDGERTELVDDGTAAGGRPKRPRIAP